MNNEVDVGRRLKSRKVEAIGIFPKARVVRGIDWSWGNQDCQSILSSASHQANSNSATLLNSGLESRDGGSGGGLLMRMLVPILH
ncbi:unnamed protein product [Protopolystoma xenopodis]|uniref:MIB/HERC2 domain-containing protein n=1 Tax=Protopolystoma xenopodis TaxID=117903 RepID=A0A3S4ZRI2_9PLAT|nr:unnamed protein product [Protopolystoma xenopodis]